MSTLLFHWKSHIKSHCFVYLFMIRTHITFLLCVFKAVNTNYIKRMYMYMKLDIYLYIFFYDI